MKVGILTFHWGANHGGVLQAYATQRYLEDNFDFEVSVIDYYPKNQEISLKNALKTKRVWLIPDKINAVVKNRRISAFRRGLNLTKRYYTNKQLIDNPPDLDVILCGSDQIWNPSYALYGEGDITPVYFANFGNGNFKKVALSVSFGCDKYPKNAELAVKKHIYNFDYISAREKSGISILESMGINNVFLTADPTALLERQQYLEICEKIPENKKDNIAICILRKQKRNTSRLIRDLCNKTKIKIINNIKYKSMENWIAGIRDANIVITNSFHCVMMCLKLHKPFWVVLENGNLSGMNDRMFTLLESFGLSDRIVSERDPLELTKIDWTTVDSRMDEYSQSLKVFLSSVTNECDLAKKTKIQCNVSEDEIKHIIAYAVKAKDNNIRVASSSGGVFSLLAQKIIESGGVVFGASFVDDYKSVKHIGVTKVEDLKKLRGSKYVESDIKDIYIEVLEALNLKKQVLFTGTPCQIGALKAFLKNDYDNLICQDVVCHGVPIKRVWRSYAEYLENKTGSKLSSVSFRDKQNGWHGFRMKYNFENGKVVSTLFSKEPYMRGFLTNLFLKPSCYNCAFKGNNSVSDITLADFWGIEKVCPEFDDDLGASLVILKTEKGTKLFNDISKHTNFTNISLNQAIIYNMPIICSVNKNPLTKNFLADFDAGKPINKLLKKYCKISLKSEILRIFKIFLKKIK